MDESKLTARKVARLVGNYAWAFGMALIGSFVGGLLLVLLAVIVYGAVSGGDVMPVLEALSTGDASALGVGDGYSTSLASALWSASMYFANIGIWIVVLVYLRLSKRSRPVLKTVTPATAGNTAANLALGLLLGFALNALCALVGIAAGNLSLSFVGFDLVGVVLMFVVVFIQSSAEELLCRCYLYQKTLRATASPVAAIAVTSVVFGLLHVFNDGATVLAIVNVMLVGVLFGLMVWKLDSPWMAFAAHASWNFTQNVLLGLPNSGNTSPFAVFGITAGTTPTAGFAYDPAFGIEGSGIATVALLVGCALVWLLGKRRQQAPTDIWAGETGEQEEQPLVSPEEQLPASSEAPAPVEAADNMRADTCENL
jgi:membrane protease YdiL (CAAX protease family)